MKKLLLFLILAITSGFGAMAQCPVEVTITSNGGFADEISWTLVEDATSTIVASGGVGLTLPDVQSYTGTGPYTFTIGDSPCSFCDNSVDYAITVDGVAAGSGTFTSGPSTVLAITTPCIAPPPPVTCPVEVTITDNNGLADEISWTLVEDATSTVVASGGPYGILPDVQSYTGTGPYTFTIGDVGCSFCDNAVDYAITVDGVAAGSGTFTSGPSTVLAITTPCSGTPPPLTCTGTSCDYSFVMSDDFGDGWDGELIDVIQFGSVVATLSGPAAAGPETVLVSLCDATPFSLDWSSTGSFPGDLILDVLDPSGASIFSVPAGSGALAGTVIFNGTGACPVVACPVEVTITDNNGLADEISWTLVEDATSTVVASGGPYGILPDVQSYTGTGPYTFTIGDVGCSFCDNAVDYAITVGGTPAGSGTFSSTGSTTVVAITTPCGGTPPPPTCTGTSCDYSFVMSDDFGDGWDGELIDVIQFGSVVATLSGPAAAGPETVLVSLCNATPFSLDWSSTGSFPGDLILDVLDPQGNSIFSVPAGSGALAGTVIFNGTSACDNDEIAGAIPITCGSTTTGETLTATQGADEAGTCGTPVSAPGVWYSFVGTGGDVIFSTCNAADYDTKISVYTGTSGALTCIGGQDDAAGCAGFTTELTIPGTVSGTTYLVLVHGFSGAVGNFDLTVTCPCTSNIWSGATSSDWSDGSNWSCGVAPANSCAAVPSGSDDAVIPAGALVTPVVTGTQGAVSVTIGAGSSITIDGTLQVCGNVDHNGAALTGPGDLELVGIAPQMLSGNGAFGFVELNNATGASVMGAASLSVDSGLILTSGTFTNGGSFALNSALGGTAFLDDFTGTGVYSGDLTVNRFITDGFAGGLGQRYFGSAVSGSTVSDLDPTYASGFPVNGFIMPIPTCDPDSIMPASPYSNLMEWREDATFPTSCVQEGWWALPTASTNLTPGRGYSGWMNNGSTISVTGAPNTGGQSYTTTNSASNTTTAQGWHVLSNPYPSPMNVNAVTSSGLTSPQYYDASSGPWSGTFQPVLVAGVEVPVMQGFTAFSAGAGSFAPDNSFRVASTNANFAKSNNWFDYRLDVELSMGTMGDITYLYYSGSSTDQFDVAGDCVKRESDIGNPTLYTTNHGEKMSLNGLNLNDLGTSVPMGLIAPTAVSSVFSFSGMNDFPANTSIYLEDKVEGIFHDLADGDYTFQADPSENGTERFEIHFVLPANFDIVEPTCDNANGSVVELTADGRIFEISTNGTVLETGVLDGSANEMAAGDYSIEVFDQFGGSQLFDFTIEESTPVTAGIIASASAVEAGESVDFEFNGSNATSFEWTINGQFVAQTELMSYQFFNPGQYVVEVFAANEMCEAISSYTVVVAEKSTGITSVGSGQLSIYESEGNIVLNFVNVNKGRVNALVYNLLGQEIAAVNVESNGKQTIQNVNWADGYYLVNVKIGEQVVNQTILLTK